jgi:hypothetical protein
MIVSYGLKNNLGVLFGGPDSTTRCILALLIGGMRDDKNVTGFRVVCLVHAAQVTSSVWWWLNIAH